MPIGTIVSMYTATVPEGWLACDGAVFDVNEYPALYTLLADNHTPDLRECNLVGVGQSARILTAHDVYALGQFKDDQLQQLTATIDTSNVSITVTDPGHTHTITDPGHSHTLPSGAYHSTQQASIQAYGDGTGSDETTSTVTTGITVDSATTGITAAITDGSVTASIDGYRSGTTTHGKNIGVYYIIKATTGTTYQADPQIYSQIVAFVEAGYSMTDKQNISDKSLLMYDATDDKIVAIDEQPTEDGQVLTWNEGDDTAVPVIPPHYEWKTPETPPPSGKATTHIYATQADYEAALLIEEGEDGYINSGDIVLLEYLDDVFKGVDIE